MYIDVWTYVQVHPDGSGILEEDCRLIDDKQRIKAWARGFLQCNSVQPFTAATPSAYTLETWGSLATYKVATVFTFLTHYRNYEPTLVIEESLSLLETL